MDNKKTIFQRISDTMNNWKTFNVDVQSNDRVLTINNQSEYDAVKREIQQQKFLDKQVYSVYNNDYMRYTAIDADRLMAYRDFEMMEYTPLIRRALDIWASESTVLGLSNRMLSIHCDDKRIKKILENLFYKTLDVQSTLFFTARNLYKYGDFFWYLVSDRQRGIVGVKTLRSYNVRRSEIYDEESRSMVVSFHDSISQQVFNNMNIAHFRLIGDDSRIPYGQSLLESNRKLWRMYILANDAMMVENLTRATPRNIFYHEMGNIAAVDRDMKLRKNIDAFKKAPEFTIDGKVNFRHNVLNQLEDYHTYMINGKKMVEVEKIEGSDIRESTGQIKFLEAELIMGLGIPRQFLSFDEAANEGKTLSHADVRFAAQVERGQKALIQELNKIAHVHLGLLGYEMGTYDFALSLSTSSYQRELLRNEVLQSKLQNYDSATQVNESTQIAAMSATKAKRDILGMSDDDIIDDIRTQFMERALAEEFKNKAQTIKSLGIFDDIIYRFNGNPNASGNGGDNESGKSDNIGNADMGIGTADSNVGGIGNIGGSNEQGGNSEIEQSDDSSMKDLAKALERYQMIDMRINALLENIVKPKTKKIESENKIEKIINRADRIFEEFDI